MNILMIEVTIEDKQKYLLDNYPFTNPPKLTDMKQCIHCNNVISVGDFKVFKDEAGNEFLACPHAPEYNGTVIDWFPVEQ